MIRQETAELPIRRGAISDARRRWSFLYGGASHMRLATRTVRAAERTGRPVSELSAYDAPDDDSSFDAAPSTASPLAHRLASVIVSILSAKDSCLAFRETIVHKWHVSVAHTQQLVEDIKDLPNRPASAARVALIVGAPVVTLLATPRSRGLGRLKRIVYPTAALGAASAVCYPWAAWRVTKRTAVSFVSLAGAAVELLQRPTSVAESARAVESAAEFVEEVAEKTKHLAEVVEDVAESVEAQPFVDAVPEIAEAAEAVEAAAEIVESVAEVVEHLAEEVETVASYVEKVVEPLEEVEREVAVESAPLPPPPAVLDDQSVPVKPTPTGDGLLVIRTEGDKEFELTLGDLGQSKIEDRDLYSTRT